MAQRIPPELEKARAEIDSIDAQLVATLARRQRVIERVIAIKQLHALPALIPQRVDEVIAQAEAIARSEGLSPELARQIWTVMVRWFVEYEDRYLKQGEGTSAAN